jgi:hypothetical protein
MLRNFDLAPSHLFAIHPGRGECGLKGLQQESFSSSTAQYVYRCTCGFGWFLSMSDITQLVQATPRLDQQ